MRFSARQWGVIGATAAALAGIAGYEGYRERSYDDGVGLHALWVQETLYGFVPIERGPL